MTNFKTLTTLTLAALFAAPAFAQDVNEAPMVDETTHVVATHFASSDLDQDGSLNADEFVTFAVMQAEAGDEGFTDLVLSGEYQDKFNAHDTDVSGGISADELGIKDMSIEAMNDEKTTDMPDLN